MKIYPVAGRTARDPVTMEPVPVSGKTVSDYDPYWVRRLRDGDVSKTASDASAPSSPATAVAAAVVPPPAAQVSGGAA
ncbi:DUF2635 domain-containing protein [Acetobacter fabarum]|uniref:DUF2635 domain-containing protein n=1 Tax=Acetobacter fabarum TaxID=483199 RepID=A0A269XX23_9PROT|nr:DUF2635 domain-containing protein [Acetobacter fabarum]PAK77828.1 hypothetical protein B8X00_09120 [Acetobacter fabarum]PEN28184.1 DUF2635 domain-containing protein [Acetobacter fabarum]